MSSNNRPWPTRSAKVWDDLSQLKRHKREVRCERGREKQRENNLRSVCDCVRVGVRTDLTQVWGREGGALGERGRALTAAQELKTWQKRLIISVICQQLTHQSISYTFYKAACQSHTSLFLICFSLSHTHAHRQLSVTGTWFQHFQPHTHVLQNKFRTEKSTLHHNMWATRAFWRPFIFFGGAAGVQTLSHSEASVHCELPTHLVGCNDNSVMPVPHPRGQCHANEHITFPIHDLLQIGRLPIPSAEKRGCQNKTLYVYRALVI